jgi:hypothetical protein
LAGLLSEAEHAGDGMRYQRFITQPVKLDQPHPVAKRPSRLLRDPQRQPGLADPTRPDQRQQA